MSKFQFPLQKLLNLKTYDENQKAIELGVCQRKLNSAIEKLAELNSKKQEQLKLAADGLTGRRTHHDYLVQLNEEIDLQKKKVLEAEKEVEAKREVLIKANQNKRTVEILKEKKQYDFNKAENRTAQINENEVALRINQNNKQQ